MSANKKNTDKVNKAKKLIDIARLHSDNHGLRIQFKMDAETESDKQRLRETRMADLILRAILRRLKSQKNSDSLIYQNRCRSLDGDFRSQYYFGKK